MKLIIDYYCGLEGLFPGFANTWLLADDLDFSPVFESVFDSVILPLFGLFPGGSYTLLLADPVFEPVFDPEILPVLSSDLSPFWDPVLEPVLLSVVLSPVLLLDLFPVPLENDVERLSAVASNASAVSPVLDPIFYPLLLPIGIIRSRVEEPVFEPVLDPVLDPVAEIKEPIVESVFDLLDPMLNSSVNPNLEPLENSTPEPLEWFALLALAVIIITYTLYTEFRDLREYNRNNRVIIDYSQTTNHSIFSISYWYSRAPNFRECRRRGRRYRRSWWRRKYENRGRFRIKLFNLVFICWKRK